MNNGTAIAINNKVYEIGTKVEIAGKSYEVYNTMPDQQLIGFAKLGKSGQRLNLNSHNHMSLSFEQIAKFSKLGAIN